MKQMYWNPVYWFYLGVNGPFYLIHLEVGTVSLCIKHTRRSLERRTRHTRTHSA